ncbi:MAG: AAA family ATPase [bacterium]|nr:AAA family ATPase [bacterium]
MSTPRLISLDYRTPGRMEEALLALYHKDMVGQERAIRHAVRQILYARAFDGGLRTDDQVAAKMLCFGPPGSGKTFIAETTAKSTLGSRRAMFKVNCTEFQQEHETADFLGSPRGYVRTDEPPILTQWTLDEPAFLAEKNNPKLLEEKALRDRIAELKKKLTAITARIKEGGFKGDERRIIEENFRRTDEELQRIRERHDACQERNGKDPELKDIKESYDPKHPYFSILLFDEIEKAHPSFIKMLFPILDKAELKLKSQVKPEHGGPVVRFCNTFIFFSSNIGERKIMEIVQGNEGGIGFKPRTDATSEQLRKLSESTRKQIFHAGYGELKKILPAPFLSRVGENNIHALASLMFPDMLECLKRITIPDLQERLRKVFPITLDFTEQAQTHIIAEVSDPNKRILGMRALKDEVKKVEEYVQSLAIKSPEEGGIVAGDHVIVDAEGRNGDKDIVIKVQERDPATAPPARKKTPSQSKSGSQTESRIAIPPLYGLDT